MENMCIKIKILKRDLNSLKKAHQILSEPEQRILPPLRW